MYIWSEMEKTSICVIVDPYKSNEAKSIKSKDVPTKMRADDIAIRQLAYEIFQEKGGSDLDNWFEAEGALNHNF